MNSRRSWSRGTLNWSAKLYPSCFRMSKNNWSKRWPSKVTRGKNLHHQRKIPALRMRKWERQFWLLSNMLVLTLHLEIISMGSLSQHKWDSKIWPWTPPGLISFWRWVLMRRMSGLKSKRLFKIMKKPWSKKPYKCHNRLLSQARTRWMKTTCWSKLWKWARWKNKINCSRKKQYKWMKIKNYKWP